MIHSLASYLRREVWLRRRELVVESQLWVAGLVGVLMATLGAGSDLADLGLAQIVPALLAYTALGFGFSLAGLTIAITIPNSGFAELLATLKHPEPDADGLSRSRRRRLRRLSKREEPPNAYLDLLFGFSWTALVHWFALMWAAGMTVHCGFDHPLLASSPSIVGRLAAGVLVGLVAYAVLQFLVTVLNLAALGSAYVGQLKIQVRARHTDRHT